MPKVEVPTKRGLEASGADYIVGIGGGVIADVVGRMTGSGFLGSLVSAAIAGAAIKGTRGEIVATVAGYAAGTQLGIVDRLPIPQIPVLSNAFQSLDSRVSGVVGSRGSVSGPIL